MRISNLTDTIHIIGFRVIMTGYWQVCGKKNEFSPLPASIVLHI